MTLLKTILGTALTATLGLAADYTLKLVEPLVVQGTELAPGDYKVRVDDSNVRIYSNKQSVDAKANVETAERKYDNTSIGYNNGDGKRQLREISFRGTKTKIVFVDPGAPSSGVKAVTGK